LVSYLQTRADSPLLRDYEWWIVPQVNPDAEARNLGWQDSGTDAYDPVRYLEGVVREEPGDDVEFGFPRVPDDRGARPENRGLASWWRDAEGPFDLHASLHGMAYAAGPWFLIDPAWRDRTVPLQAACRSAVEELGYRLHDVERRGEKGFHRIAPGFSTRPDSRAMRAYFLELGEAETAEKFRPSSMETIRSFGGDPLTLVTELPLFLVPGVGEHIGPPDAAAERFKVEIARWLARLAQGEEPAGIRREITEAGVRPMPVEDAMRLVWTFLAAGLDAVSSRGDSETR
jgi:hypothetical protein